MKTKEKAIKMERKMKSKMAKVKQENKNKIIKKMMTAMPNTVSRMEISVFAIEYSWMADNPTNRISSVHTKPM